MPSIGNRIRQARRFARLTQSDLSCYANVARSAVAQWERRDGVTPTVRHLIDIAIATDTGIEWLATGRGQMHMVYPNLLTETIPVIHTPYQAQNALEQRSLDAIRALPVREAQAVVEMMEVIATQRPSSKTKRAGL